MAEVVGLLASVFTLGEVTVKVIKLKRLCDTIRNVPDSIRQKLDELDVLNSIMTEIESEAKANKDYFEKNPAGAMSLRQYKRAVVKLEGTIQTFQAGIQARSRIRKTIARVQVALDRASLSAANDQLHDACQVLQLALTLHTSYVEKNAPIPRIVCHAIEF